MENKIKIMDQWDVSGIEVKDPGLKKYIGLEPVIVPKTGGTYSDNRFHKSHISIVERLINKLMVPGHKGKKHKISSGLVTGNASTVYNIVEKAFKIIEKKLNKNPIEVLVRAVENGAPREEITTITYGGARYPKPVECAPQRRVDFVLRMIAQGSYQRRFKSKKKAEQALAEEIIDTYEMNSNSTAISKKMELERQADSAR